MDYPVCVCRHIVRYTQDCFYNAETWQESDLNKFIAQAEASALESQKKVYDPLDGTCVLHVVYGVVWGRGGFSWPAACVEFLTINP